jgi:hypothetical protein
MSNNCLKGKVCENERRYLALNYGENLSVEEK